MKKLSTLFIFLLLHLLSNAQGGIWTWVKGDSTVNSPGNRGTVGVTNNANYPPGRYQAAQWTDLDGNFWIFGGLDSFGLTNDLWKYNPATTAWTWVGGPDSLNGLGVYGTQGIPGPHNTPGARGYGVRSWTDQQGRLWLNGGVGFDAYGDEELLDDLWMYDITANEWTWMKGSNNPSGYTLSPVYGTLQVSADSNSPGQRQECSTAWVRSDNTLWTFGGSPDGTYQSFYNDVWRFDIGTNNWTWMNGPQGENTSYSYGTMNVESPTNLPPSRMTYTHWQDAADNFYIFGGANGYFDSCFNDVWKYNTTDNLWTWIGGSPIINDTGLYTQVCSASVSALPPARFENRSIQMNPCSDICWTFGGFVNRSLETSNDLWNYNNQNGQWTWLSGGIPIVYDGNYGLINVSNVTNMPPARAGACLWIDTSGTLWMWGGGNNDLFLFNDMWKFVPDASCISSATSTVPLSIILSDTDHCQNDSAHLVIQGGYLLSLTPASGASITSTSSISLRPDSTTGYTAIVSGICRNTDTARFTITVCAPDTTFTMPNAFTPNGDHKNDLFYPVFINSNSSTLVSFKIYNRWGQLIYDDPSKGWDGTYKGVQQPEGIYTYFVTAKLPDTAQPGQMKEVQKEGTFALVR